MMQCSILFVKEIIMKLFISEFHSMRLMYLTKFIHIIEQYIYKEFHFILMKFHQTHVMCMMSIFWPEKLLKIKVKKSIFKQNYFPSLFRFLGALDGMADGRTTETSSLGSTIILFLF